MKKKIPLDVLRSIEPYVNKKGVNFNSIYPDNFFIKLIDADENSDFYFNIESYKIIDSAFHLLIEYKPYNSNSVEKKREYIKMPQLDDNFKTWLKLLADYDNVKSVFDDPILESYANEYYTDFEILDEDAEISPYPLNTILFLDSYLERVENNIEKFEDETNTKVIQEIKTDAIELRNNLTKKSKKWVAQKLARIWGKMTKQSLALVKEFVVETRKEFVKGTIKYIGEHAPEIIHTITEALK